jgi:Fe-S cluster biosynthesis and repair protein YggX
MGGAGGQQVLESVCAACWQEWRETSAQLINHYGLVLGDPAHRQQLRLAMWEFLNLEEG